jgi:hypothetical protein
MYTYLILLLHNFYSSPNIMLNDQLKEDEMGRACSTHGGEEECIQDSSGKARKKETTRKT